MSFVRVALGLPIPQIFDYAVPPDLAPSGGDRVVVPFGSRRLIGIVIEVVGESALAASRIRPIEGIRNDAPRLPADWIDLMRFLASYYQRPLGETVINCLPPRLRSLSALPRAPVRWFRLRSPAPEADPARSIPRQQVLDRLASGPQREETIVEATGKEAAALRRAFNALRKEGIVEPSSPPRGIRFVPRHPLGEDQAAAVDSVRTAIERTSARFQSFLLHGVTGSGKTEVYMQLVADTLGQGGQALVLVPEIGLTPQLESRFRAAFPDAHIAILHSALPEGERTAAWLAAARGDADMVLGTRLAVLAPMPRLSLVVVDEEHDASFKQQEGLRYSGRDAAVYRARLADCPVVLGSATPSLESWANQASGRYRRIDLPHRAAAGSKLPEIRIVDISLEPPVNGISSALAQALEARLERGEQSLVFINRRGYAPALSCAACDWVAGCERCTARLVLHASDRRLRCHHCGDESPIPRACPTCGNVDLRALGRGTQRVEETLAARFSRARIVRIDRDSARRRGELARSLDAAQRGDADILVGTQLLAKGHDFPALTLVGVLDSDNALLSTDYRSAERLYATLAQVAGRAGRRERPGEVLVQTRYPRHPLFAALVRHDYGAFATAQLAEREAAGFPPHVAEAVLRAEAVELTMSIAFLRDAVARAPASDTVTVYDPVPLVITRKSGFERAKVVVQSPSRPALQSFLSDWSATLHALAPRAIRWHLDVDPTESD